MSFIAAVKAEVSADALAASNMVDHAQAIHYAKYKECEAAAKELKNRTRLLEDVQRIGKKLDRVDNLAKACKSEFPQGVFAFVTTPHTTRDALHAALFNVFLKILSGEIEVAEDMKDMMEDIEDCKTSHLLLLLVFNGLHAITALAHRQKAGVAAECKVIACIQAYNFTLAMEGSRTDLAGFGFNVGLVDEKKNWFYDRYRAVAYVLTVWSTLFPKSSFEIKLPSDTLLYGLRKMELDAMGLTSKEYLARILFPRRFIGNGLSVEKSSHFTMTVTSAPTITFVDSATSYVLNGQVYQTGYIDDKKTLFRWRPATQDRPAIFLPTERGIAAHFGYSISPTVASAPQSPTAITYGPSPEIVGTFGRFTWSCRFDTKFGKGLISAFTPNYIRQFVANQSVEFLVTRPYFDIEASHGDSVCDKQLELFMRAMIHDASVSRTMAFAMGMHPRLGGGSSVLGLNEEILQLVHVYCCSPRMVGKLQLTTRAWS